MLSQNSVILPCRTSSTLGENTDTVNMYKGLDEIFKRKMLNPGCLMRGLAYLLPSYTCSCSSPLTLGLAHLLPSYAHSCSPPLALGYSDALCFLPAAGLFALVCGLKVKKLGQNLVSKALLL